MIGGQPAEFAKRVVSTGNGQPEVGDFVHAEPEPVYEIEEEDAPVRGGAGWLPAVIAAAAVLGWLATATWLALPALRGPMEPVALIELLAAMCVPPALIAILYLLALRTSRAEAKRFGATARAMRAEAASLERVVATLARKISENRELLAEQTNMLIAMGDRAVERLESVSGTMGKQARTLDTSTRTLAEASADAERRVEIVLSSLPRAHDEMREMANRVDAAGLLASQRAAALDAQLTALAERGREADSIAGGAAERLAAHIARMEATSETASARLEQVTGEMSSAVDTVLESAAQAVDEARKGIAAQGEAILAMLSANQAALDRAGRDSAEALGGRMAEIEERIGRISARLGEEQGRGEALFAELSGGVDRLDRELQALHASGMERTNALATSVSTLHGSMDAMAQTLRAGEDLARRVIGTSEDLLTALDASAREIDETLPAALSRLDQRIATSRQVVAGTRPDLLALVSAAESTHEAVEAIADVIGQQRDSLSKTQASLIETLATSSQQVVAVGDVVDETIETTRRFAETAAPQLVHALARVRETASAAADHAREAMAGIAPGAAHALEEASSNALRRAVDSSVRWQLAELAEATEAAVGAAARASERLSQQMMALANTTSQIDAQIADARAEIEAADSDSFSRRVSLLIEALNSSAIDIAKAFSAEVADSAWAAYLKGDRGVFTRRAVRLLDPAQSREVARLYDADAAFRENVNRYIHDFEGMLRHILTLRDGSQLGITLLSSDMGKLYVVLAQAIERLRT